MKIGYGRVSTQEQSTEAQRETLLAAGCEEIYLDKVSGKLSNRPELDKVLLRLREGDTLVITKLDRLGRSLKHLIELSEQLRDRGIDLAVLAMGIDTSTSAGRMFFHMIGAVAEFERELIVERTKDGLAVARTRGRVGGRKKVLGPRQAMLAREMYDELGADGKRAHTVAAIAKELGVSRPTIYRYLEKVDA